MQDLDIDGPSIRGLAAYSGRDRSAGILLWRLPFGNDTTGQQDVSLGLALRNVPFQTFDVAVQQLDEDHRPRVRAPVPAVEH